MAIFLTILKIIGITLLVILAVLLTLILLVLFVPIRYKIKAVKGVEKDDIDVDVRVTWLLHFVNVLIKYTDKLFYRARIIIFTLVSSEKKEKSSKKRNTKKKDKSDNKKNNSNNEEQKENTEDALDNPAIDKTDAESNGNSGKDSVKQILYSDNEIVAYTTEGFEDDGELDEDSSTDLALSEDLSAESEENLGFVDKLTSFINKIQDIVLNIDEKFKKTIEKIKDIIDNIDYYINALQDERNLEAFALCISELKNILKNIKPKIFKGNIHVGFEDPYTNGQVAAILGVIYPFMLNDFKIDVDFEEVIMEGDVFIKGRVTVFVLIRAAWKLYFNKNVKRMIKIFKKEEIKEDKKRVKRKKTKK